MTAELLFALVLGLLMSFGVFWFLKFKYILPIEKKIQHIDLVYSRFRDFTKELTKQSYAPDTMEAFIELINHSLIKLHNFFPETSIAVFEKDAKDESWKSVYSIYGERLNSLTLNSFVTGILNKSLNENDIIMVEDIDKNFDDLKIKSLALFPFVTADKKINRVILIGIYDKSEFEVVAHYVKYLAFNLSSYYKVYEKNIKLASDNAQVKKELNAVLKELDMAGSRLIKKAKERKAIYDVVAMGKGDLSKSIDNIIAVAAKVIEADMAAFLYYDDSKRQLVTYGKPYIGFDSAFEGYSLPLDNLEAIEVKSFIEKKPFLIEDTSSYNVHLQGHESGKTIKSLLVMPVYMNEDMIGILEVASSKKDFFNSEHMEFVNAISSQISEIMSILNLYKNLSTKAQELSNMNKIKDEFLSTVSHELKTPLTTIKGFISVLLSGEVGTMNDQQLSFLNIVEQAANRLSSLITNLLDISRLDGKVDFDMSPFNILDTVKDSINHISVKAMEKNMKINFIPAAFKFAYVTGDRHWLTQVMDNLLLNAVKYSPVSTEVNVNVFDRGDVLVVSVEDSGPGIDTQEQKLVFEKFYRGKETAAGTQGTGLGLSISRSIIEKHNGKIWVESKKGEGSKFFFALPKVKALKK